MSEFAKHQVVTLKDGREAYGATLGVVVLVVHSNPLPLSVFLIDGKPGAVLSFGLDEVEHVQCDGRPMSMVLVV